MLLAYGQYCLSRDRFRTQVNVWGDSVGAGIVERLCQDQLSKMDDEEITEKSQNGELNHGYADQSFNTSL